MADDTPPSIGTAALRRQAAAARAAAGAQGRIAPAPPADEASVPWAGHREPRPMTQEQERKNAADARATGIRVRKPKVAPQTTAPVDRGFDLVDTFLLEWRKNITRHNIGYANTRLAQRLVRNGAMLIKLDYKIDQLGALIRLGNELLKGTIDEGDEDRRIDEIRKASLARTDLSGTTPENENAGEEEEEETGG